MEVSLSSNEHYESVDPGSEIASSQGPVPGGGGGGGTGCGQVERLVCATQDLGQVP